VATMSRYLQFDTSNPPGNEMVTAEWLKDQLIRRGITSDIATYESAPGRAVLIGRIEGCEPLKPLVLNHHMDVVPADPAQWSHPPFGGEVAEGYVWGRGALDTKDLGVMHLLALERLVREGVTFRRPVIFLAVPDEETGGSQGMSWLVEHHLNELDPEWVWDEGGGGVTGMLGDQPMFGVAVAEKQIQHLRLVATGEAGHGSMPHDDNANVTLMHVLERVLKPRPMRVNDVAATMFREMAGAQKFPLSFLLRHIDNPLILRLAGRQLAAQKTTNAMLRDTISLTMLKAGYKVNVIPERAEAGIDCRLLPDTGAAQFRRWLETTIADERVKVEEIETSTPTAISPITSSFLDAVRHAVARHVPGAVVFPLQMPGGSDARFFRAHNIPAYGFGPAVLEMSEIDRVHGVDERISVENLVLGVKIACDVIRELCVA
ncbi:MAG: M20/M25/M40 family metallo-hydrolase, partial [Chloroflexota bacterium]|nr:M20/M25/M40 family metallo-hydrolase [Chloroflexota bacterium]